MQAPRNDASRRAYLSAMGVRVWVPREGEDRPEVEVPETEAVQDRLSRNDDSPGDTIEALVPQDDSSWAALREEALACRRCALHVQRKQVVFGVGSPDSDWLIVGEAPGAEEDRRGEPFVGPAGQLLDAMLRAIGLDRQHVYIANVLKCRPPGNRDPQPDEVATCSGYLDRQIDIIRPRVILAVGRFAAQHLLGTERSIGALRGQVWPYSRTGASLIVTYHPSYLLRKPADKAKAWRDLCLARDVYRKQVAGAGASTEI